jgi:hypothetical protein
MLTVAQIEALAPDASSVKSGRDLANPRKWVLLGADANSVWGECQGSGKDPYQTQIELANFGYKCTCPSRKLPCKHTLGLLFLLEKNREAFSQKEQPVWVKIWLDGRVKRAEQKAKREENPPQIDTKAQSKRQAERYAKAEAGLTDLELWLQDVMRNGLAHARNQGYNFWNNRAARMQDAQMPGIRTMLFEMGSVANSGNDWQERLTAQLAKLNLLIEGFKRLDRLPPEVQADIRTAIGWTQKQEEILNEPTVRDNWLVVGQSVLPARFEDNMKIQKVWLYGEQTKRYGLVLSFSVHNNPPLDTSLVAGTKLEADLVFYPSAYPLRCLVKNRHTQPVQLEKPFSGYATIKAAFKAYAEALSKNVWLSEFPAILEQVTPVQLNANKWILRDRENSYIPILPTYPDSWQMLAHSAGHPLTVFGEWDGEYIYPLVLWSDQRL